MRMRKVKKLEIMHFMYGKDEKHTCSECCNFFSGPYNGKERNVCKAYGVTPFAATGWKKNWCSCGHFDTPHFVEPLLDHKQGMEALKIGLEMIDSGQIDFSMLEK